MKFWRYRPEWIGILIVLFAQALLECGAAMRLNPIGEKVKSIQEIRSQVPCPAVHVDPAPDYVAKPLPQGEQVKTGASIRALHQKVLMRHFRRGIRKFPPKGQYDAKALDALIESCVKQFADGPEGFEPTESPKRKRRDCKGLLSMLESIKEQGVIHPVLQFCRVRLLDLISGRPEVLDEASACLAMCEAWGYEDPWMQYWLLMRLGAEKQGGKKSRSQALKWLPRALHSKRYKQGEEAVMSYRLVHALSKEIKSNKRRKLVTLLQRDQGVPQFISQLADGWVHVEEAWEDRGSGWAQTVTEDGWRGFNAHLEEAEGALTASWEAQPNVPQAACQMITVAKGKCSNKRDERMWFDRAVAAQFDYIPAYKALAWALRPRWHGSHEAMMKFADECARTERYDTAVPWFYCEILTDIYGDDAGTHNLYRDASVQTRLDDIYSGYRSSRLLSRQQMVALRTHLAAAAVLGGRYSKAYEYLHFIDFKVDHAWIDKEMGVAARNYIVQASLYGGPIAEEVRAAEALAQTGSLKEAQIAYDLLLEKPELSDEAHTRLQLDRERLNIEKTCRSGEWVEIFPGEKTADWVGERCHWQLDDEGRLMAGRKVSVGAVPLQLSFEQGFELEVDVDFVGRIKKKQRAVLLFSQPGWHQFLPMYISLNAADDQLRFDSGYREDHKTVECSFDAVNRVRVVARNKKVSVWVNEKCMLENVPISDRACYAQPLTLHLGDYYSGRFRKQLRFHRIRCKTAADNNPDK